MMQISGDPDEPNASFESARLKVRWAEHHIKRIQSYADEALETHGQIIGLQLGPALSSDEKGLSPFFALHVGDAIFSLRSALDCCWMGLKRAVHAEAAKGTLPRAETRDMLLAALQNASVERHFAGSDSLILNDIRPYRDGKEVLWFGGKVDNWNKHNRVIISIQRTAVRSLRLIGAPRGNIGSVTITNSIFEGFAHGGLLAANEPLRVDSDYQTDFTTDIVLLSKKPVNERSLMPFLTSLFKETHEAVELFVLAFGKKET